MKMGKMILVVVLVIITVLAVFAATYSANWESGAPEARITVEIKEVDAVDGISGTADIQQTTLLQSLFSQPVPMTTYTQQIPALNPTALYTITMTVDVSVSASNAITKVNTTAISGYYGYPGMYYDYLANAPSVGQNQVIETRPDVWQVVRTSSEIGQTTSYEFNFDDIEITAGIYGNQIDRSKFDIEITSEGYDADGAYSYGKTTATLILDVGDYGEVNIIIQGISAEVSQ